MNKVKFLLIFVILAVAGSAFALTGAVRFTDATGSPLTKAALDIEAIPLLGAAYTVTFPTSANRWRYQYYTDGGDGIISPLDGNGAPTGDDFISLATNAYTTGTVSLTPANLWAPTAAIFAESPGTGNTYIPTDGGYAGDKVFLRIFNANTIAAATKSMVFTSLYTLTTGTTQTISPYIPAYAWGPWVAHVTGPSTYTVDITSVPAGADIYVGPTDSGFNTPHQFELNAGDDATYTVQMAGYSWSPTEFVVTDIAANTSQAFTGTLLTYDVEVTSVPTGATILVNGARNGRFVTPHTFTMDYGTSATYSVEMAGYTWAPTEYVVSNIMANDAVEFVGTLLTYDVEITSTPAGATILVDGARNGRFVTPHTFTMDYGTSATYSVEMAGYTWAPTEFVVTNIMANTSQHFVGTLLPPNTYTVDITSVPTGATILVNGARGGRFVTPHQFVMEEGTSATYSVEMAGYTWAPTEYVVSNIMANDAVEFVGTLLTYDVEITSTPAGATILVNGARGGRFVTPHTFTMDYGTSATYSVEMAGYTWAPTEFVVTNIMANTSQNFVGTLLTYDVEITSTPAGATILVDGARNGRFVTPHTFTMDYGTSATYSVEMAGYTWAPTEFVVTNITANTSQNFVGTLLTYTVDITSTPSGASILVDGAKARFETPHQFVMDYGTSATYTVELAGYTFAPTEFVVTNIMANTSQHFVGTLVPVYWDVVVTSVPTGQPIYVDGVLSSRFVTPHTFSMLEGTSALYSVVNPLYTWVPEDYQVTNIMADDAVEFVGTLIPVIPDPPVITWPEDEEFGLHFGQVILSWYMDEMPPDSFFDVFLDPLPVTPPTTLVYHGTNMSFNPGTLLPNTTYNWFVRLNYNVVRDYVDSPIFEFTTDDQALPIELSSFTAILTSQLFVNLTWVTQTETQVLGFNIHRANTNNYADAYRVNQMIIPATNTSSQHTYNFVDEENLQVNNRYYYWLENIDMNGMSTLYGPQWVTITDPGTTPVTEISVLNNAYPNPFHVGQTTNIRVDIKTGETGTVTIYNLLGQVVKTFKVPQGTHYLSWNAKGRASGIYFYKLSTPSTNVTKKLVIVN